MSWLKNLLSGGSEVSSMRLVLILCVMTAIGLSVGGVIVVLKYQLKPDYLTGIAGIVATFLTTVVAKVIQSFAEKKPANGNNGNENEHGIGVDK
jgi:hypothetical protein